MRAVRSNRQGGGSEITRRLRCLVIFSGPDEGDVGLPAALRRAGFDEVVAVDTKVGGGRHDVTKASVRAWIEARLRVGDFDAAFLGTPCESMSVAHRPQIRGRTQPSGLRNAPREWWLYLAKHNAYIAWSAHIIDICEMGGVAWAVENPADRGDESGAAWWEAKRDHAPLWLQPAMAAVLGRVGATLVTFPQCAFGAPWQKFTTVACSSCLRAEATRRLHRCCSHTAHAQVAHGRDASGVSWATRAAAYPQELNDALAALLLRGALTLAASASLEESMRTGCSAAVGDEQQQGAGGQLGAAAVGVAPPLVGGVGGGRVAFGAGLGSEVHARCVAARCAPARFASLRNLARASGSELLTAEMPGDGVEPMVSSKPLKARRPKGRALPAASTGGEEACDAASERPLGRITIWQLYGDGIYELEIRPWLHLAAAAAAAIERGEKPPAVPTLRIPQPRMPAWARGVVWDTRDPYDCREVEPSTRATVFPGARQMDRAELRRVAAAMRWHDRDIVDQAGEGGIEPRSSVALETVLAFHHAGLVANLASVRKVVDAHQREGWVTQLFEHLPMVPCRLTPRNVVMQERARVADSGQLESYLKPRVTSNSSDGGAESTNGGIPLADRYVRLPVVQSLGRGAAMVQAATTFDESLAPSPPAVAAAVVAGRELEEAAPGRGDGGGEADCGVAIIAVDLESAYSFCVVQRTWWWTQVFYWWEWVVEADGSKHLRVGLAIDTRLGFGGAFAPNRFERITLLLGAWIERAVQRFDVDHPYPPRVRQWSDYRRRLQLAGGLPGGPGQLVPRYWQVYIDDYNRAATTDWVGERHEYSTITIDESPVALTGGVPAPRGSRAVAHAQITITLARAMGFADSPSKTCVGDGVGSLGFSVDVAGFRIRCPARKQQTMAADVRAQASRARAERLVAVEAAGKLVGRLVNLSQIYPELRSHLHGGYAVANARVGVRRREGQMSLLLAEGGAAQREWLELLEEGGRLLADNDGVPLASSCHFVARTAAGVWTSTTDASGVDGVGGYVFTADAPSTVWLVSERWPPVVLAALRAAASEGAARQTAKARGEAMLSMPAAELVGSWLVPSAVSGAMGVRPRSVYAVTDCEPAACALNSATGGNPQMRVALEGARRLTRQWLAVHVRRHLNFDADRLSHPRLAIEVAREAAAAGLVVREARITDSMWADVRRAACAGVGGGGAIGAAKARRKRSRPLESAGGGVSRRRGVDDTPAAL